MTLTVKALIAERTSSKSVAFARNNKRFIHVLVFPLMLMTMFKIAVSIEVFLIGIIEIIMKMPTVDIRFKKQLYRPGKFPSGSYDEVPASQVTISK